ncbi:hypothetical protein C0J52_14901 [Blattella germanica]|nr:hypothetical protein C0J52_14901 [Blattella germanica]
MSDWFVTNGLCMNVNKTQSTIFSLNNNECNLEAVKLLGIWLDNKLSIAIQMNYVTNYLLSFSY